MLRQILDQIRALLGLITPAPTFVVDIGVVAGGAGYAAELRADGKRLRVRSVWFSKPSAQVTLRLIKATTPSSGGTSTSGTVVGMRGPGAIDSHVLLFTAAPTAGTAVGDVFEMVVGVQDNVEVLFGDDGTEALELEDGQALGINVSVAATIVGRVVFQEVNR